MLFISSESLAKKTFNFSSESLTLVHTSLLNLKLTFSCWLCLWLCTCLAGCQLSLRWRMKPLPNLIPCLGLQTKAKIFYQKAAVQIEVKKRRYIQMLMKKSELTFSNNQFVALHLIKSVQIIQILSRCQVNG